MKISTNTIAALNAENNSAPAPITSTVDVLAEIIGAQLGAVEEVTDVGAKYVGVVIARVVSCEDHPNADRLHVCKIDDGGLVKNVERDEQGHVQVVCGAPNVREGLLVAWLPPASTVPESFDNDPFVLEARALRGVVSNGMLASPKELSINDSHEGILEISDDIQPGTYLVDAVNLRNDNIIDIENKMFTHRPDCFGWLGVAREIAGIQHQAYTSPDWYMHGILAVYEAKSDAHLPLIVNNEVPELVPRFIAVTMSDVVIKDSPLWLQMSLVRHGIRPINNVVDITNYMMLLTGQPLHAYDYDKVRAQDTGAETATIGARHPVENEALSLLNGKTIKPRDEAVVITSASKAIGLGGVMGGGDTEVDENTKNIILECATFDMYSIRRTAMAHGIFTDAVTRFNKGQSPLQNKQITEKTMQMLEELAGARFVEIQDINHANDTMGSVEVTANFVNERLGLSLSAGEMATILKNVEFDVELSEDSLHIDVPFWRTDISIAEDVVEEIGRLYGYDHLPKVLPTRTLTPARKDDELSLKQTVRSVLSKAGANEALTYSFVHGNLIQKVGQDTGMAFQLSNALSPDLQYYRLSVSPSLLDKIHMNIKSGYDEFVLFEIGKAHAISAEEDNLPLEWNSVAMVYAANPKVGSSKTGAAFYEARQFAVELLDEMGVEYEIIPASNEDIPLRHQLAVTPFDPSRSAYVVAGDNVIGVIGEYAATTRRALKLPDYTAGFELSLDDLQSRVNNLKQYTPLSKYPKVEQDITFRVGQDVDFASLKRLILGQLEAARVEETYLTVTPLSIYQAKDSTDKNISFRISLTSYVRTLTDTEVNGILDKVAVEAQNKIQAERV